MSLDTTKAIEQKVVDVVSSVLGADKSKITESTNFTTDIRVDSLDMVEMMMQLEDVFNLQIPEEEAQKMKTVGEVIEYIKRHKQ